MNVRLLLRAEGEANLPRDLDAQTVSPDQGRAGSGCRDGFEEGQGFYSGKLAAETWLGALAGLD
jgi:hypothetical protein